MLGARGMGIVKLQAIFSGPATLPALLVALAIGMTACGGGGSSVGGGNSCPQSSSYGGGGSGSGGANCTPAASPTPVPTAAAAVGILLTGESPVTTVSDGTVLGYFLGTVISTPSGSGAVTLTANTTVKFMNLESGAGAVPHTASFLGDYSGSYPATFTNTNGFTTASATGSVISSANFSTGSINPGASSAAYNAGGPGMYVFGCAYHYLTNNMRTVIIVM